MALLSSEPTFAASSIKVEREVAINSGNYSPPRMMVRAIDGGYWLATQYAVIKLDMQGRMVWSYKAEQQLTFTGVAATPEGGVLACGTN